MENEHYAAWSRMAPRGLALIGLGLSITGDAIVARATGRPFLRWFAAGTLGLIVVNWGVSVFGEAVKQRVLFEQSVTAD